MMPGDATQSQKENSKILLCEQRVVESSHQNVCWNATEMGSYATVRTFENLGQGGHIDGERVSSTVECCDDVGPGENGHSSGNWFGSRINRFLSVNTVYIMWYNMYII